MDVPPEVAFRNVEPTEAVKQLIADGLDDLEEVYDRITSVRVMVEETNPGRKAGKLNHVRVEIGVPGSEIVVNRNPPEHPASQDLHSAIREAFGIARRQLREFKRRQRGDTKRQDLPPHGRVVKLAADSAGDRFGFLMAEDGREIYFHENAVLDGAYDDLEVGDEVRFAESGGDEGPMASTVAPLDVDTLDPDQEEEVPLAEPSR